MCTTDLCTTDLAKHIGTSKDKHLTLVELNWLNSYFTTPAPLPPISKNTERSWSLGLMTSLCSGTPKSTTCIGVPERERVWPGLNREIIKHSLTLSKAPSVLSHNATCPSSEAVNTCSKDEYINTLTELHGAIHVHSMSTNEEQYETKLH